MVSMLKPKSHVPSAAGLVPLLVRLLYPKMRKRSGRLGGKGAPGSARAAILNYLAALDSIELAPLVQLFLQPISAALQQQQQLQQVMPSDCTSSQRCAPPALLHCIMCLYSTCSVCWGNVCTPCVSKGCLS